MEDSSSTKLGLIYVVTYIDGRSYVGRTLGHTRNDLERRKREYLSEVRKGSDTAFHRALRKYGSKSFIWSILEVSPIKNLDEAEIKWIQELDSYRDGFNSTLGGDGVKGLKLSQLQKEHKLQVMNRPDVKERHRAAVKKFNKDPEYIRRMSEIRRKTQETIEYQMAYRDGIDSPEAREKMRLKAIERWSNPDNKRRFSESIRRGWAKRKARLAEKNTP